MLNSVKTLTQARSGFLTLSLTFFMAFGLWGILNHAMWRDEMTIWLIVRDTTSWGEFLNVLRYEPHPILWYFCVAVLQQFSQNPVSMQLFHLLIGVGVAYLILTQSPFPPLQKILLTFGYLPFYEYLLISRNYSLGLLFGLGVCALWKNRQHSYIGLSILLFFMANSNAYSLFIALALGATLMLEWVFIQQFRINLKANLANRWLSFIIFLSGIILSLSFLIPPPDNLERGGLRDGWQFSFDLRHLLTTLARIWNSYIVIITAGDSKYYSVAICGILGLGILLFFAGFFCRKPLLLFFYLAASSEILLFTYTKFLGAQRHFGHLFIVLVIAFWLSYYYPPSGLIIRYTKGKLRKVLNFCKRYKTSFFVLLLYAQLAGGIAAYIRDITIPYSASQAAAEYIQAKGLNNLFIVGSRDVVMSPLTGYLNRKIYYPERQGLGSFVLFTPQRQEVDESEVLRQVQELVQVHGELLLILSYPLTEIQEDLTIRPLANFHEGFIYNERYNLYRVSL
ncbi:hypothetical protein [Spirulina subsalsa]|uniref:hypothetical protein n=1 Tax=Spirulina subsalsa TaxID=54311 RepID=UPI0002F67414|nr:hypothetical protein [Spirulina subsalsa]